MRNISILGSTGSIGTQTLEIVRANPDLKVCAVSCDRNITLAEKQIREFKPEIAAVYNREAAEELRLRTADTGCKVYAGMEGLIEAAVCQSADIVLTAVVGMVGIEPAIAAINAGKDIALANKETLVCAGQIIMPLAREKGVHIYPVDSEHSAIFQSLQGNEKRSVERILLTASGGPFRGYTREQLEHVTPADALRHPTWSMGKKITIDCATLVNKGLEVIEASWLFDVPAEKIKVVVHPQSIVHSMVGYADGAVIAQLSCPDMKLPILYALYYPERRCLDIPRLDFWDIMDLHFEKPDTVVFPALDLAYRAIGIGGSMPAVFNAANEYAVSEFLAGRLRFCEIPMIIQEAMDRHKVIKNPSVEEIIALKEGFRN